MSGIHQMMLAAGLTKYTTSGTFTSTSGTYSGGFLYGKGYDPTGALTSGIGFGSAMSPTTLTDGKTIQTIFEFQGGGPSYTTTIRITGFSSNPGASYFSSITVNSITVSAATFTYAYPSAGVAEWVVSGSTAGVGDPFSMPTSGSVSWTLTNYG